jgi:hypothetical protein
LTLSAGNYLLQAKLSMWPMTWAEFGDLECYLGLADDSDGDYASIGQQSTEKALSLLMPVTLKGRSTVVKVGCKLYGTYHDQYGVPQFIQGNVWGVRMVAVRIGRVVKQ